MTYENDYLMNVPGVLTRKFYFELTFSSRSLPVAIAVRVRIPERPQCRLLLRHEASLRHVLVTGREGHAVTGL